MRRFVKEKIKKLINKDDRVYCIRVRSGRETMYIRKALDLKHRWYLVEPYKRSYFNYWEAMDIKAQVLDFFGDENLVVDIIKR